MYAPTSDLHRSVGACWLLLRSSSAADFHRRPHSQFKLKLFSSGQSGRPFSFLLPVRLLGELIWLQVTGGHTTYNYPKGKAKVMIIRRRWPLARRIMGLLDKKEDSSPLLQSDEQLSSSIALFRLRNGEYSSSLNTQACQQLSFAPGKLKSIGK